MKKLQVSITNEQSLAGDQAGKKEFFLNQLLLYICNYKFTLPERYWASA